MTKKAPPINEEHLGAATEPLAPTESQGPAKFELFRSALSRALQQVDRQDCRQGVRG